MGIVAALSPNEIQNSYRLIRILNATREIRLSESSAGIQESLRWIYANDSQKEALDLPHLEKTKDKKEEDAEWMAKFAERTKLWDQRLSDPKRISLRKEQLLIQETEKEVDFAKSKKLYESGESIPYGEQVKFEGIKSHLNNFRSLKDNPKQPLNTLRDLEVEIGRAVINLGTYPIEGESEGCNIKWGSRLPAPNSPREPTKD
jgi:hypothetical protein